MVLYRPNTAAQANKKAAELTNKGPSGPIHSSALPETVKGKGKPF